MIELKKLIGFAYLLSFVILLVIAEINIIDLVGYLAILFPLFAFINCVSFWYCERFKI